MGRIVTATWLPTLLFVISTGAIAAKVLGWVWTPITMACALILTPALWWWLVGRRTAARVPRGLWAGVLAGIAPHVLGMLVFVGWAGRGGHQADQGLGQIGDAFLYVFALGGAGIGAAVGGLLGIAVVVLGRMRASRT